MDNYFDIRFDHKNVSFCYSRKPSVEKRDMHPYHEILYYIDGDATFICESFRKKLSPKTLLIIPREHFHYFQIDSPSRFERLKISLSVIEGFENTVSRITDSVRLFENLDGVCGALLDDLCDSLGGDIDNERARAMAMGTLLFLLSRLDKSATLLPREINEELDREGENMISNILRYIDENLTKDISAENIAKYMNISSSTLSHIFKKHLGISLHQYIIQKRLITAQRLISEGGNPTTVCIDCGYGDYSSFYKAYVKMFGSSPSDAKKRDRT